MHNQKFPDDVHVPTRSRSKAQSDATSQSTCKSSMKRQINQHHFKPWFSGINATGAGAARASTATATMAAEPIVTPSTSQSRQNGSQTSNGIEGGHNISNVGTADAGDKANRSEVRAMPYHDYNPIVVRQTQSDQELPIQYWFYVYLYSSDVDKFLTPFVKMVDSFGTDRRLTVIMNRCGVQILLKELELYKSLPRRIVVIKGSQWTGIVKALIEMEERLPDLMRFATFPLLLDTDTTKFACTKFDRTACVNRLTKLIH